LSLAEKILAVDDLTKQKVDVPEWASALGDVELFVRELTGAERGEFEDEWAGDKADVKNLRAKLVARTLVTEDGERVFSDRQLAQLGKKSGGVLARLSNVAMELSGFTESAIEDALGN
jgi:hypothetical protein